MRTCQEETDTVAHNGDGVMLTEDKWAQYGADGLEVEGIVIHNTGNINKSAKQLHDYMQNECKYSTGTHYFVDHEGVVQVLPLTWRTWTTGKGNDWAFDHCIAIEICDNLNDELYQQGQDNAVALIRQLMSEYNLGMEDLYFHNDFNERAYCPHIIMDRYGSALNFYMTEIMEE